MQRMKRIAWLSLALAGACGDPRDIDHVFGLGAPHAPGVAESLAAMTATWILSDAATFVGTTDAAVVSDVAGTVSQLPDGMMGDLAGAGAPSQALAAALQLGPTAARYVAPLATSAASLDASASSTLPPFDPGCLAATATGLTYSACRTTMAVGEGDSVVTLDGTVQRSPDGVISWDLVETVSVETQDAEAKRVVKLTGTMTVASGLVSGQARSDAHTLETDARRIVTTGVTTFVDVDVATASPFCISGGTVELRRIWTERATDQPAAWPYVDGAFRFSWSACGAFVVARSF